jgi:hypothetical protein
LGYSARYHAASLAAIFLALAVGILIGVGLGDSVVSDTEENLRESLEGDIENAQREADEIRTQLDRERAFAARAYPALVGETLAGQKIGLLAFGDLPTDVAGDVEAALEPTGGELVEVAVARMPPDVGGLTAGLGPKRAAEIEDDPGKLEGLGQDLGAQFALGTGKELDRLRNALFLRSSGEGGRLDGVILYRAAPGEMEPEDRVATDALQSGLVTGVVDSGVPPVSVERSGATDSSVGFLSPFGVTTVDSVDLTSGRVSLVFGLLGAKGSFGIKSTANSLLPELLEPSQ